MNLTKYRLNTSNFTAGLFFLCFFLISCVTINAEEESSVEFYGKISVKGSEPFTYLSITVDQKFDYGISGPLADRIKSEYQQQYVVIKGKIDKKTVRPGVKAVIFVEEIVKTQD